MGGWLKVAEEPAPLASSSPLPQVEIKPALAAGKRGPVGTSPRTNYSKVNTGTLPTPDAGSEAQKSMAPRGLETLGKVAFSNEDAMATMTQRPRLQDMLKTAMASSIRKADITFEAARQAENQGVDVFGQEKVAKSDPPEGTNVHEYALKLAAAVEYIVDGLEKEGKKSPLDLPPGVSQSELTEPLHLSRGHSQHEVPIQTDLMGLNQLSNDIDHTPGGTKERMVLTNSTKKTGSVVDRIRKMAAPSAAEAEAFAGIAKEYAPKAVGAFKRTGQLLSGSRASKMRDLRGATRTATHLPAAEKAGLTAEAAKEIKDARGLVGDAHNSERAKVWGTRAAAAGAAGAAGVLGHQALSEKTSMDKAALLAEGAGALLGGMKAVKHSGPGAQSEGMLRGGGGVFLGSMIGAGIGAGLGAIGGPGAALGLGTAGAIAGSIGGYKHLTRKYDGPSKHKTSSIVRAIRTKLAEDAINPAQISKGHGAVPPDSSAAGESGGQPAGGAPQGPLSLIATNDAAQKFTKLDAYRSRKEEMKKYLAEPMMYSDTDKTLSEAFAHTGEAGAKISSALTTKTAAAKALIARLTEEATESAGRGA